MLPSAIQSLPSAAFQPDGQARPAVQPRLLQALLAPRTDAEGRVRLALVRWPEARAEVGCFSFKRYQQYAALRALRLAQAWVHNTEAGELHTLMTWDGQVARGYLVDLDSSLGGSARRLGPKDPMDGWWLTRLWSLATFGVSHQPFDPHEPPVSPAVGLLSASFDPPRWRSDEPNIAFDQMTDDDARWIAGRIAAVSRAQLAAAVAAGEYARSEDAEAVVRFLERRQAAIRQRYLPATVVVLPSAEAPAAQPSP